MGAKKKIKLLLAAKGMTQSTLARKAGRSEQTLRNLLSRDSMRYETVEQLLDAMDCDIVFRDRNTGKIYED